MEKNKTEMKETRIKLSEIARKATDIFGRVQYNGETFVVSRYGKAVAKIVPIADDRKRKSA